MIYTEVVVLKSRQGKTLESVRDAFPDEDVAAKKTVIRNLGDRVIIYNFSNWTAEHWHPGNPGNRRTTNINKLDL